MTESIFWIALSAVAVIVAAFSRERHPVIMSMMLTASCLFYNAAWLMGDPESWPARWAIGDAILFVIVTELWMRRMEAWKLCLCALLAFQGIMHLWFYSTGAVHWDTYLLALNVSYLGQLLCVSWQGGKNAWNSVRHWFSADHGGMWRFDHLYTGTQRRIHAPEGISRAFEGEDA